MPIYEYTCEQCSERFEQLVRSMSSDEKGKCPKCGSAKTTRSLSVFAVGSESARSVPIPSSPGMCGRCGGPGPCSSNF